VNLGLGGVEKRRRGGVGTVMRSFEASRADLSSRSSSGERQVSVEN